MTELPDGSGCFTATIMSEDEAMALPLKERPLNHRISSEMYHAVFEAVGHASMCWNPRPGSEVFDTTEAEKCAVDLCFKIANEAEKWRELSATEVCAGNPAVAEYIKGMEDQIASLSLRYKLMRAKLVDDEARTLYGGRQAAANYTPMEKCLEETSRRFAFDCPSCGGTGGLVGEGMCDTCIGSGRISITEIP